MTNTPPQKNINHGMTAPKPSASSGTGPHISQAVRESLKDQDPEKAARVLKVTDSK